MGKEEQGSQEYDQTVRVKEVKEVRNENTKGEWKREKDWNWNERIQWQVKGKEERKRTRMGRKFE